MSVEGNLLGTVQLSGSFSHLDAAAKTQVVLVVYWEVQKTCGTHASPYQQQPQQEAGDKQELREPLACAYVSAAHVTIYNKPCTLSLKDGVVTVQLGEKEQMQVRAVDLKIASTVPVDPCGLVLLAQSTRVASTGAASADGVTEDVALAIVLTIPSAHSLSRVLFYIMNLNSSVRTAIPSASLTLPPSTTQEENPAAEDEPPQLTRKISIRNRGAGKTPLDLGSHLPVAPSESSADYPIRGELCVNKRAQDCTSGIYDSPPKGPPKRVTKEDIEEEKN